MEKVKNSRIYEIVQMKQDVVLTIGCNKLTWQKHVRRRIEVCLTKILYEWSPRVSRKRVRSRMTLKNSIEESVKSYKVNDVIALDGQK